MMRGLVPVASSSPESNSTAIFGVLKFPSLLSRLRPRSGVRPLYFRFLLGGSRPSSGSGCFRGLPGPRFFGGSTSFPALMSSKGCDKAQTRLMNVSKTRAEGSGREGQPRLLSIGAFIRRRLKVSVWLF